MSIFRCRAGVVVCLLAIALAGCGGGPRMAKVTGRVTVAGQPLTTGTIMFHPESGPTAVGGINADGTYTLSTLKPGDGAVVGAHRVTIEATKVGPGSMVEAKSLEEEMKLATKVDRILVAGKVEYLVPQKLSQVDTSGLTAQVEAKANRIDFDVPRP
jgi:hypothetical protein